MLITEKYRAEQTYLHTEHPNHRKYGTGKGWTDVITNLYDEYQCSGVLDYGCGKALLNEHMTLPITNYDPGLPEFAALPRPHDLVVCMDVLEHVEPELLQNVLKHLHDVTIKVLFVTISLKYAGRYLRDGRNAHLIVKPATWWIAQLDAAGLVPVETYGSQKLDWVASLRKK